MVTLRELHARIGDLVEGNERAGHAERNEHPVWFRVCRGSTRKRDWYIPLDYVLGGTLTLDTDPDPAAKVTIVVMSGQVEPIHCQTCDGSGTDEHGEDCRECQKAEECPHCGAPIDYCEPTAADEAYRRCSDECGWAMR